MLNAQVPFFQRKYVLEFLLAGIILLFFAGSLPFPFLMNWDDGSFVVANPQIGFTAENVLQYWKNGMQHLWTPLTMNSLQLDHLWSGDNPAGYRAVNLLLHIASALAAFRILQRLGIRRSIAFFCILIWAVHPQRIESVVWITERKDVLCGFLALLSLLVFMKETDAGRLPWISVPLFLLAIAAKPAVFGIPAAAALYAVWKKKICLPKWQLTAAVLILIAAGAVFAFFIMDYRPDMDPPWRIFRTVTYNLCFYVTSTLILPRPPDPCYPLYDGSFSVVFPGAALIFFLAWYLPHRTGISSRTIGRVFLCFGIVWFLFFLPTAGGFRYNPTDFADRYNYLPALTFAAFVAFLAEMVFRKEPGTGKAACLCWIVLFLAGSAYFFWYLPQWRSEAVLFGGSVLRNRCPNVKSLVIAGKSAMAAGDIPMMCACADGFENILAEKTIQREDEHTREACFQSRAVLVFSSLAAGGRMKDASGVFAILFPRLERRTRIIDGGTWVSLFKRDILRLFAAGYGTGDLPERVLLWADRVGKAYGLEPDPEDWSLRAAVALRKKDLPGAVRALEEYRKLVPDDRDAAENLRILKLKLKK